MKNGATYFKYSVLLIIVLATIWFFRGCGKGGSGSTKDTISVRIDTVWMPSHDSLIYQPVPYKVTYVKDKILHDTLESIETVLQQVDSARILEQYLSTRFYDTTINIQYGNARLKDTVTQNRISGRSVIINQSVPVITKTVTLTTPKRLLVYVGIDAYANSNWLLASTGATIGLKLKNDKMFELKALLTKEGIPQYGIGLRFPIKLHK